MASVIAAAWRVADPSRLLRHASAVIDLALVRAGGRAIATPHAVIVIRLTEFGVGAGKRRCHTADRWCLSQMNSRGAANAARLCNTWWTRVGKERADTQN